MTVSHFVFNFTIKDRYFQFLVDCRELRRNMNNNLVKFKQSKSIITRLIETKLKLCRL